MNVLVIVVWSAASQFSVREIRDAYQIISGPALALPPSTMRGLLVLPILVAYVQAAQLPLRAPSPLDPAIVVHQRPVVEEEVLSWDKEPDFDATGNRIFNSVSELMQLWPGTVIVQGEFIFSTRSSTSRWTNAE